MFSSTPRPTLPPGKTRYPLYKRLGGPQGRSGQVRKISPPTGIRSPDRPARSQSLYRLSYPAHNIPDRFSKNTQISKFIFKKRVQWGGGTSCSIWKDRQTDDEANSRFSQFFRRRLQTIFPIAIRGQYSRKQPAKRC